MDNLNTNTVINQLFDSVESSTNIHSQTEVLTKGDGTDFVTILNDSSNKFMVEVSSQVQGVEKSGQIRLRSN